MGQSLGNICWGEDVIHVGNSGELFLLGAVLTGENCVNWFGTICKTSVEDYVLPCSLFSILLPQAIIISCFRVSACMLSHLSRVQLFATLWTEPARFLCPWDSPGKNTGVGWHDLLQGIFLTERSNPCFWSLLHWQVGSLPLVLPGKLLRVSSNIQNLSFLPPV